MPRGDDAAAKIRAQAIASARARLAKPQAVSSPPTVASAKHALVSEDMEWSSERVAQRLKIQVESSAVSFQGPEQSQARTVTIFDPK